MPTARQSVPKHIALAREPPVTIGRFNLFLADVGVADFSISLPEQCPYPGGIAGFLCATSRNMALGSRPSLVSNCTTFAAVDRRRIVSEMAAGR